MSNLGPYQEITTRAAQLGGVDQLISDIGAEAVAKAAPHLTGRGVVLGVALSASAVLATLAVKERHAVLEAGKTARTRLIKAFASSPTDRDDSNVASPDTRHHPSGTGHSIESADSAGS